MDQLKIGRFIAECRKKQGLTQASLAERLNITDRAVSKWETGKSLPDSSIMLELCGILGISVNDMLSGEVVNMENYSKELEKNLIEMVKQKEEADRRLLRIEVVIGAILIFFMLVLCAVAAFVAMPDWLRIVLILIALVPILAAVPFLIRIEQTAGYYECKNCKSRYVPKYKSVFMAPHFGTTRQMRCPHCHKITWHKKVISKE